MALTISICNIYRLVAAPIIIEGEEQRNNSGILLRLTLSIPRAEFREILKDASIPLLEFQRDTVRVLRNMIFNVQIIEIEIIFHHFSRVEHCRNGQKSALSSNKPQQCPTIMTLQRRKPKSSELYLIASMPMTMTI